MVSKQMKFSIIFIIIIFLSYYWKTNGMDVLDSNHTCPTDYSGIYPNCVAPSQEQTTKQSITVATVNIYDAKIVAQKGNTITLSFDISNREGIQPQIKYGIELIKEDTQGQTRVDEKVYDEILSLSENSQVHKEITYQAPANLKGEYTILISSKNTNGFPLALAFVGKVILSTENNTETIDILPETCFLQVQGEKKTPSYIPLQGVDISSTENLIAVCTIVNNSNKQINLTPKYETRYRTSYGEIVPHEGGDVNPIILKPLEKKNFSLVLPKATKPQAYDIKVSLMDEGMTTNAVVFHYVLQGASATIQNILLDKDYYQNGDTAKLSFMWSSSADGFPESRAGIGTVIPTVSLTVKIVDVDKKSCITELNQILSQNSTKPMIEIPVSITASCMNPNVLIVLKDGQGNILAEESFIIKTTLAPQNTTPSSNTKTIVIILTILILAGITFYIKKINKNKNETNI